MKNIIKTIKAIKPYRTEVETYFLNELQAQLKQWNPQQVSIFTESFFNYYMAIDAISANHQLKNHKNHFVGMKSLEEISILIAVFNKTMQYFFDNDWTIELIQSWENSIRNKFMISKNNEIGASENKMDELDLKKYLKECAQKVLRKAIDEEASNDFNTYAHEKAKQSLYHAIEFETEKLLEDSSGLMNEKVA